MHATFKKAAEGQQIPSLPLQKQPKSSELGIVGPGPKITQARKRARLDYHDHEDDDNNGGEPGYAELHEDQKPDRVCAPLASSRSNFISNGDEDLSEAESVSSSASYGKKGKGKGKKCGWPVPM